MNDSRITELEDAIEDLERRLRASEATQLAQQRTLNDTIRAHQVVAEWAETNFLSLEKRLSELRNK